MVQGNVPCEGFLLKSLYDIGEAVTRGIDVGIINLLGIAGQHYFGACTCAGQNGFNFVGSEVLGLIHN